MSVRSRVVLALSLLAAVLVYVLWPVYGFIAESNASLRPPWSWQPVPATRDCQASLYVAKLKPVADQACSLLMAQQKRAAMPSISAAIAIKGQMVWSAATGWSNLSDRKPATTATLYRIGSTSKPVTGTLLARMVDAGLVDLDEPIATYVQGLPNPEWEQLTLRQLASHTAGLPEYQTNRDLLGLYHSMALRRPHRDVRQGLALFDGSPLRHPPGEAFEYSSFGTLLLANVLQSAGDAPFTALLQDWVLEPLALGSPLPDQPLPERASFYQLDGTRAQRWRAVDLSNKLPGGGFMARPEDLVMLGNAWLNSGFISAKTRDEFWTPQSLSNGEINPQSYALTWRWNENGGYAHHGGVSKGAMAWLAVYPESELVIAMTTNTTLSEFSDFGSLQAELVALFSGQVTK